jgi:hypothetical protein
MGRRAQGTDITPWGVHSPGTLRDSCKAALEMGYLSVGALLGEHGGGAPLLGASLYGGSVGQPGVGSSTGDLEIWLKGALVVECLSLWELCEENLEGGLPCWGP